MDSPYKGLFSFSRKEQVGLIFFLIVIVTCLLAIRFQEVIFPIPEYSDAVLDSAWLATMDSTILANEESRSKKYSKKSSKPALADPFPFDPNTASITDYVKLGFSQKQAESIHRYLEKGGRIRQSGDFKKLYVVNDFMYNRLEPYIQIKTEPENASAFKSEQKKDEVDVADEVDVVTMLELNSADSIQLEALPGIGPVFTRRIIEYRSKLGGYSSVDQLQEVYGMDRYPEVFEKIKPLVFISSEVQRPIDVNTAEWVDLVRHPYIEKHVANSIIALREQHGPYRAKEDIKRSHLINDELYKKLEPYVIVSQ